jgi:arginyl-tRNA synthetase
LDYKKIISDRIRKFVDLDENNLINAIEIPPKGEMGDYAFPCFQLSKAMHKAPNIIAEQLKNDIDKEEFEKIEAVGPYLNFFVDKSKFAEHTIQKILKDSENYGTSNIGEGKNIVIDYSSPNIAKPFHIGHLFTTVIGSALYKILKSQGYNCIGVNHLGDWGTQFGKLIAAYKKGWADEEKLENDPINELLRIYVKFHEEVENTPELEDEGRMYFKRLEEGHKEEVDLWQRFKDLSLKEFAKVYDMLNIKFDSYAGESFYTDKMDAVMQDIENKGILTESNGAKVVMLEDYNMPPCIIQKSDGATIYATRDLTAAIYRKKTYDFYKNIYVVGNPQTLHFKQVFKTLELMGNKWAKDCVHVGFGLVKFPDNKKLSTRTGDVIFLEDLLKEAINKTLQIMNEKNPDLENKEEISKKVGIGAMIFTYLKNNRDRDIVFDWDEMLSFEGETGPYVQYTYARAKSVLRRVKIDNDNVNYKKLNSKDEFELVKLLEGFQKAINISVEKLEPSIVTRYVIDVAKAFNKFYNLYSVLNADDEETKIARVKLVEATTVVIKNGLSLIGIDVVEKM